jgi:alpha,alpha-trehalase
MAGTIDLIQRCYIGIEMRANALHFDPALPDDLRRIKVRLRYRRQVLSLEVDHDMLRIGSRSFTSVPIKVAYRGHYRDLAPGETCEFRLIKPEERDRDENRSMKAAEEAER